MLTKLRFENFRGFKLFDASLDRVSALLGPNSSGKTSALHAIRLACDAVNIGLDSDEAARATTRDGADWIQLAYGVLVGDHTRLLPLADWRALFVDQSVSEGVRFTIDLTFDEVDPIQAVSVEVSCARNEQLKLGVRVRAAHALASVAGMKKKSARINQQLTEYVRAHAPRAVFIPPFYGTVRDEEFRARVVLDRLIGSGDQSHVVRNLVAGLTADQFTQLNAFLENTIRTRLTRRTSGDAVQTQFPMEVFFRDSNGELELSAAGAGLVNLVSLYSALSRWETESKDRRILFLLDEPEAHLHPRLQAESAARVARLVTESFGAQLVLATHSVDILNRLSANGARLLRTDRTATPSVVALESDSALFNDLSTWADLTPYTAINFLASRRVVFCEGKGDLSVLPRMAAVRFRNDPRRLQAFRQWALIELVGSGNAKLPELLARLVRNDVLGARGRGETFHVEVALDRDYERSPGTSTRRDVTGVEEATTVWSRHSIESVLAEAPVLVTWIRALPDDKAPANLAEIVAGAIHDADREPTLCREAEQQLTAKLLTANLTDDEGKPLSGAQKAVHAVRRAQQLVQAEPAVWQRGKDRANFILGRVRPHIDQPARNQFPADVIKLIERADINRVGDTDAAVPREVGAFLDRLAPAS